jgi:hypothetical protein
VSLFSFGSGATMIQIVGFEKAQKRLASVGRSLYSREMLNELGQFGMTAIKTRTVQGRDVDGKPFKPYSEGYRLFRIKKGRPVNKVNLTFTGSMLGSMTYDIGKNFVRIYFLNTSSDVSEVKNSQKAFFLNQDRNFFALSEQDKKRMSAIVRRFIRIELGKIK